MVLNRARAAIEPLVNNLGRLVAGTGIPATAWTFAGFLLALLSGVSISNAVYGGPQVAGIILLLSGFLDVVDGAVARASGTVSVKGGFLDSTLDRMAEVAFYSGVLLGGHSHPLLVILSLSASLLVSYVRAKGESLGLKMSGIGIGERAERLFVLAISSGLGLVHWGVVLVLILASVTFAQRVVFSFSRL